MMAESGLYMDSVGASPVGAPRRLPSSPRRAQRRTPSSCVDLRHQVLRRERLRHVGVGAEAAAPRATSVSRPFAVSMRIFDVAPRAGRRGCAGRPRSRSASAASRRASPGRASARPSAASAASPSRGDRRLVALALHEELERDDDVRLVVDDEDALASSADSFRPARDGVASAAARRAPASSGSTNENVAPCPSSLSTQSRPPKCSTICRLIGSPRPVPARLAGERVADLAELLEDDLVVGRADARAVVAARPPARRSGAGASRTSTRPARAGRTSPRSRAG